MLRCKVLKIPEMEINGVKLSNTAEILQYICKQEERIAKLEKENIELLGKLAFIENAFNNAKAQIEKMKCCGNCENRYGQEKCADCHNYSKWKFKQAEQFYEEIVN